ncbi:Bicarbonate transporter, C-terminal [Artemisia annua]|uniref:Bicarbonate transporter, C-terminal n=1 Tax=Artemisia annua TaxID=35608 RepID=A0A2U1KZ61_ARTAN|nr:Bicarbonate transporter, C-terminal [Artemisia annua]
MRFALNARFFFQQLILGVSYCHDVIWISFVSIQMLPQYVCVPLLVLVWTAVAYAPAGSVQIRIPGHRFSPNAWSPGAYEKWTVINGMLDVPILFIFGAFVHATMIAKLYMDFIPECLRVAVVAHFASEYEEVKSLFFTRIDDRQWENRELRDHKHSESTQSNNFYSVIFLGTELTITTDYGAKVMEQLGVSEKKWGRVQTRNMERMNSMRDRGKRSFEGGGAEDDQQQPERKRPF